MTINVLFDQIIEDARADLEKDDITLLTEAFHKIGIIDSKPRLVPLLTEQVSLSIDRVLENNPKLHPICS